MSNVITLVNKQAGRLVDYPIDNLSFGDCYEGENVRDRSTMTQIAAEVPHELSAPWLSGWTETSTLDDYAIVE